MFPAFHPGPLSRFLFSSKGQRVHRGDIVTLGPAWQLSWVDSCPQGPLALARGQHQPLHPWDLLFPLSARSPPLSLTEEGKTVNKTSVNTATIISDVTIYCDLERPSQAHLIRCGGLNCVPRTSYVGVLTPETPKCDLTRRQDLY